MRLSVLGVVREVIEPLRWNMVVDFGVAWSRVWIINHHLDVLSLEVRLQFVNHNSHCAVEFGPDLDSEKVLAARSAFVKKSDARKHISTFEVVGNDAEDKLSPEDLEEGQVRLEIDPDLATILVNGVLPLRLNFALEQTHATDTDWVVLDLNTTKEGKSLALNGLTYNLIVFVSSLKKMLVKSL